MRRCRECNKPRDPVPLPRFRQRWREMLIEGLAGIGKIVNCQTKLTHYVRVRGEPDGMAMTEEEALEAVRSLRAHGARWSDISLSLAVDVKRFWLDGEKRDAPGRPPRLLP